MNTYVEPWEKSEDTNYLSTFFIMIIYKKKKLRQECNFHLEKLIANNQPKQSLHCDSQIWNKKQITTGFSFTCVLYTTSPPADATTHIFPFVMDSTATIRFSLWREGISMVKCFEQKLSSLSGFWPVLPKAVLLTTWGCLASEFQFQL